MHRLLITGVGSNIGQGIQKGLKLASIPCEVIGTDVYQYAAGFAWCQAAYKVPYANDADYVPTLIRILQKHKTQLVLIGSESETVALSKAREKVEKETQAKVVVGEGEFIARCSDKWGVVEMLKEAKLDYPASTIRMEERKEFARKTGFPCFIKPRHGWAARDVHKIDDAETLDYFATHLEKPILQEYLDGEEYTCALVFDREEKFHDHVVMRREILNGTSFRAEIVSIPTIDKYVTSFAKSMKHRGPLNLQLRLTPRGPVAFEINPRFSGTTGMRAKAGFNDVAAIVRNFLEGTPISKLPARPCKVLRYWDEVVVEDGDPHFPK